jgi:hypothetical protein
LQLSRAVALAEPAAAAVYVFIYIWYLRRMHPLAWLPLAGFLLLSHVRRGEGPGRLGINGPWREPVRQLAPWLSGLVVGLLALGAGLGTIQRFPARRLAANLVLYLAWGLVQQYLLNGYFLNRLRAGLRERTATAAVALLFSGAHAPNPFLMGLTLAGGWVSVRIYLKWRNLLLLGGLHGLAGFLLHLVVPDRIARNFLVGPRYFEWSP